MFLQFVLASTTLEYMACLLSIAFASFVFALAVAKDVKVYFIEIAQHFKSRKMRSEIMAPLSEYIQFTYTINLKELSWIQKENIFWNDCTNNCGFFADFAIYFRKYFKLH